VIDSGHYLFGVACPTLRDCVAVDDAGRAIEGNPRSSRVWTFQPIARTSGLDAVACTSVAQCVAVGDDGRAFVGTPATETVRLTSSATISLAGQRVILTALVRPRPRGGTMMFLADGHAIPGCAAVVVSPSRGTAICQVKFARPASYSVQAAYAGAPRFTASQSLALKQTVRARRLPRRRRG
jgi:hypothetical protein